MVQVPNLMVFALNDKVEVKMLEHIYNNDCRLEQKRVVN